MDNIDPMPAGLPFHLRHLTGLAVFGPAYGVMNAQDTHAPGSVDRVLMERMAAIRAESAAFLYSDFTPIRSLYARGSRPELEAHVERVLAGAMDAEERVARLAAFTAGLGARVQDRPLNEMRFGGTEEDLIRRGSDWCTDVARVACALCQVAGVMARMVYLADTQSAYCGHAVVELFRRDAWGAVDGSTGVVYRHADGRPASTWELMESSDLVRAHAASGAAYTDPRQFRAAAVSNYFLWESARYDYTVSGLNPYAWSILEQAERGWPDGLRWLHGEDQSV